MDILAYERNRVLTALIYAQGMRYSAIRLLHHLLPYVKSVRYVRGVRKVVHVTHVDRHVRQQASKTFHQSRRCLAEALRGLGNREY
jgi:hypothetical protein